MTTKLAAVIRARMEEKGISQTELAARIGAIQQSISALVGGEVAAPRKWKDIARELEIPEDEMRQLMIEAGRDTDKNTRLPALIGIKPKRASRTARGAVHKVPMEPWSARRLPIYGKAVGGDGGEYLFNGQVIDYVPCPPVLDGVTAAYGIYVDGESMSPRYLPGELVYVHPGRPPRRGDDVVVQIRMSECEGDDDGAPPHGFIKRYVGYTPTKLVLEQYNPAKKVEFDRETVVSVHTIVGRF